jgi:hypothetical protein
MFLVYKKDNQRRISWNGIVWFLGAEAGLTSLYVPEKAKEVEALGIAVVNARKAKAANRHELENKFVGVMEQIASIIEKREGFKPIFFKEV